MLADSKGAGMAGTAMLTPPTPAALKRGTPENPGRIVYLGVEFQHQPSQKEREKSTPTRRAIPDS